MGKRIVVLVSGSGSNLQALLDDPALGGRIVLVASDRHGTRALGRAKKAGVETAVVDFAAYRDRTRWDAALYDRVWRAEPDALVLAGFMRILPPRFVETWPTINTHPALLPAFPGAHGVRDALDYGVKVSGATVHFCVAEVDAGPIIAQQAVAVEAADTVESLHERIKAVEHGLLCEAVRRFCNDQLEVVEGRRVKVRS